MKDNKLFLWLDDDEAEILYYSLRDKSVPESSKTGIIWSEIRRQMCEQLWDGEEPL